MLYGTFGLNSNRRLIARTIVVLTGDLMGNVCKKNNKSTPWLRRECAPLNLNRIQLATEGNADIPSHSSHALIARI